MRPLVRTTILTLLLLPPAMLWGIGVVVREEWPPRLLMGVTAAVNVGYWLLELRGASRSQPKRLVVAAIIVLLNALSWYWGRSSSSGIGIVD